MTTVAKNFGFKTGGSLKVRDEKSRAMRASRKYLLKGRISMIDLELSSSDQLLFILLLFLSFLQGILTIRSTILSLVLQLEFVIGYSTKIALKSTKSFKKL